MNTMKKLLATLALGAALAAPAMAGTISFGSPDTVIGVTSGINASPTSESVWIASILGTGYGVTSNIDGSNVLLSTGTAGRYAIDLTGMGDPAYVLLKNATTYLLVRNDPSKNYLVFDWSDSEVEFTDANGHEYETSYDLNGRGNNSGQTSISHYALVSAPTTPTTPPPAPQYIPVPEPATLGLMGFGLVAAGLRRRRKAA